MHRMCGHDNFLFMRVTKIRAFSDNAKLNGICANFIHFQWDSQPYECFTDDEDFDDTYSEFDSAFEFGGYMGLKKPSTSFESSGDFEHSGDVPDEPEEQPDLTFEELQDQVNQSCSKEVSDPYYYKRL